MEFDKKIFSFTILLFLFPVVAMADETVITGADTVWNQDLIPASSDVTDSTDAPEENLITWAFVSHADSVWNVKLEKPDWAKPPEPPNWSFAVITDLHIGRGYPDYDGTSYEDGEDGEDYYLTERLKKVVDWLIDNKNEVNCGEEKCPIEFLAVLGDIADTAEKSEFIKAKEILDKLPENGIPYVPVFGNHDVWPYTDKEEADYSQGEEFFDEIFWNENATNTKLLKTKLNFQRDDANPNYKNFAFNYKEMNFIGLDFVTREEVPTGKGVGADAVAWREECAISVPHGTTCPYIVKRQEALDWLKDQLEEFNGKPVIIFSHHPFAEPFSRYIYGGIPAVSPLNNFESAEIEKIEKIIEEYENISEGKQILGTFGCHIHSFEEFLGIKNIFFDANWEYLSLSTAPVITTEALMVGSNEEEPRGIIRIVKVNSTEKIEPQDYNNWETTEGEKTEFVALNPQFEWYISKITSTNEPLEYTFISQSFTKRKISSFEWDFGSWLGKKFGKTITILRDKLEEAIDSGILEKIGLTKVKLPIKLTLTDQKTQQSEYLPRDEIINLGYAYSLLLPTTNQAISQKTGEKLTVENRNGIIIQMDDIRSGSNPVGFIKVNFDQATGNINLADLVAQSDPEKRKSILYMPQWPDVIEKEKILFIPK